MSLFFDLRNDLRTLWRIAAFIVVLMPAWLASGLALTLIATATFGPPMGLPQMGLPQMALNTLITLVATVTATVFSARIVDRVSVQSVGMGFHKSWARNWLAGVILAGGLVLVLMLGTMILGQTHLEWSASQTAANRAILTLTMLIVAAAFEELLFRGYPLQILMKGIGAWPAMIVMSCIFGLLHANNPNASPLGVFNTIVAGMMLSLAYFKTRSLWFPYGLHLGWNVALGMVVGFPLSGEPMASLWTTHVTGAQWLLGGEYGPEGGALGTIIFLAGAVAVWKFPSTKIHYDNRFYKNTRAG